MTKFKYEMEYSVTHYSRRIVEVEAETEAMARKIVESDAKAVEFIETEELSEIETSPLPVRLTGANLIFVDTVKVGKTLNEEKEEEE